MIIAKFTTIYKASKTIFVIKNAKVRNDHFPRKLIRTYERIINKL